MAVTKRVATVIADQYGTDADSIVSLLEEAGGRVFREDVDERVVAAVVILANGRVDRFFDAIELMETDWRDLLIAAGLAHADWPSTLDSVFGPK